MKKSVVAICLLIILSSLVFAQAPSPPPAPDNPDGGTPSTPSDTPPEDSVDAPAGSTLVSLPEEEKRRRRSSDNGYNITFKSNATENTTIIMTTSEPINELVQETYVPPEEPILEPEVVEESSLAPMLFGVIAALLVVLAITVILWIKHAKKEASSRQARLQEYISKCLSLGYKFEDIAPKLTEIGWHLHDVQTAYEEIRRA